MPVGLPVCTRRPSHLPGGSPGLLHAVQAWQPLRSRLLRRSSGRPAALSCLRSGRRSVTAAQGHQPCGSVTCGTSWARQRPSGSWRMTTRSHRASSQRRVAPRCLSLTAKALAAQPRPRCPAHAWALCRLMCTSKGGCGPRRGACRRSSCPCRSRRCRRSRPRSRRRSDSTSRFAVRCALVSWSLLTLPQPLALARILAHRQASVRTPASRSRPHTHAGASARARTLRSPR